ncbi:MAG TPA: hypothetical protein VF831_02845, partial [Anaerolineales bacterium]
MDTLGGGFVTDVILEVKSLIFPTTFEENVCTPFAIEAAKSAPGTWGVPTLAGTGAPTDPAPA